MLQSGIINNRYLGWEEKISIFEHNCLKCKYARIMLETGEIMDVKYRGVVAEPFEYICVDPVDLSSFGIKEGYISLTEICRNGCLLWQTAEKQGLINQFLSE